MLSAVFACSLPAGAQAAAPNEVAALLAAPCPAYRAVVSVPRPPGEQDQAIDNHRYRVRGRYFRIVAGEADWSADPFQSQNWRTLYHGLSWLDVLFQVYTRSERYDAAQKRAAVARARDLVLDWIRFNPIEGKGVDNRAWRNKVVGDRIGYIGYLARTAACEGLLTEPQAARLLDSLRQHGDFLTQRRNYRSNNHGLFMDYGLALLADYAHFLRPAGGWRDLARRRFQLTLRRSVQWDEGVALEHSSAYHLAVRDLVDKFVTDTGASDSELAALLDRMTAVSALLTMPDSRLVQFGDTQAENAGGELAELAEQDRGLHTLRRSGFAFVKIPESASYLGITAGHHSITHKSADELSFDLYEHGRRIVSDTGHYHSEEDRFSAFARSSQAHSTLTVDGRSFAFEGRQPYGSGILASGDGDGWFAILGTNPLLRPQGVRHERLYLYKPGIALVIVDRVRAGQPHEYRRHVQLGPEIDVQDRGGHLALQAEGFDGALFDDRRPKTSRSEVRGVTSPLMGFTFPSFRRRVPRWTVIYETEAQDAVFATTLALASGNALRARVEPEGNANEVVLHAGGRPVSRLTVVREGSKMGVAEQPLPGAPPGSGG